MTTTPETRTPEQIAAAAVWAEYEKLPPSRYPHQEKVGNAVVAAFRAAGLLVGDPTEEQVERAARALYDTEPIRYTLSIHHEKVGEPKPWDELNEATKGVYRRKVIKVLAAAGAVPPALDEAKLAEVIDGVLVGCSARMYVTGEAIARAVVEWWEKQR